MTAFSTLQKIQTTIALVLIAALGIMVFSGYGGEKLALFAVGLGLGIALHKAAFGFTGAYRKAFVAKDMSGIAAQIVMVALAIALFAPVLAAGEVFGQRVGGAFAPVSVSVLIGAFMFGLGMQLAGGCASGTLFTAGGGSIRMVVVLLFFCLGAFWGSLDLAFWLSLPSMGAVSLGRELGWVQAVVLQLLALGLIFFGLKKAGLSITRPLWWQGFPSLQDALRGPWPLLWSGILLTLFNLATLLIAGHPWSVTWGLTLWGAKIATAVGWDPATSGFWQGAFQSRALAGSLLADTTSLMNIGIIMGAFLSAAVSKGISFTYKIPVMSLVAAVVGGLMIGYGARLAFGCNIGAFFSGVASGSLHGWLWLVCAVVGNYCGVWARPYFALDGFQKQKAEASS